MNVCIGHGNRSRPSLTYVTFHELPFNAGMGKGAPQVWIAYKPLFLTPLAQFRLRPKYHRFHMYVRYIWTLKGGGVLTE